MGLRLMIFDTSDVKRTWAIDVDRDGSPDVDLSIDLGLSHSWFAGGALYKCLRQLDACRGFDNWPDALRWVADYRPSEPIDELQYWGHGSPGYVWMRTDALTAHSPDRQLWSANYGVQIDVMRLTRRRLHKDSLIWFRTCSTFAGESGHQFAKSWANTMGCRIAGYTHIIGPWQSGLHSIRPGEEPSWSLDEGILEGTPAEPKKMKTSAPWAKNTINCLRSKVPEGW